MTNPKQIAGEERTLLEMAARAIKREPAMVWRGGGRRWFTLQAACKAEAKQVHKRRFASRCECDWCDTDQGKSVYTCAYHSSEFYFRFVRRVTRLIGASMKEEQA